MRRSLGQEEEEAAEVPELLGLPELPVPELRVPELPVPELPAEENGVAQGRGNSCGLCQA